MPKRRRYRRVRGVPIAARSFVFLATTSVGSLGVVAGAGGICWANENGDSARVASPSRRGAQLSEADVIRLARKQAPAVLVARGEANLSIARERGIGLYPNPTFDWERESIPGDVIEAETEDTLQLTIPIDLGGKRNAETAMARSEAESARSVAARNEAAAVSEALSRYYAAIGAKRRVHVVKQRLGYLEEAERIISSRKKEGRVAGYEEAWVQVETDLAQGEMVEAEAEAATARLELAAIIGRAPATLQLPDRIDVGQVSRVAPPDGDSRASAQASELERPAIQRAKAAVSEAKEAGESAGSAWIPVVSASGGAKRKTTNETKWGYVVGVEVDIPLFSNGQGVRAEAAARTRFAKAALARERAVTRMEVARAETFLARTAKVLERFDAETAAQVARLVRGVESGYREGHRTILELAEAQRVFARAEEYRLKLVLARKRAEIALRAARGEFE